MTNEDFASLMRGLKQALRPKRVGEPVNPCVHPWTPSGPSELSDEYLSNLQRKIDGTGYRAFTSVSRADFNIGDK